MADEGSGDAVRNNYYLRSQALASRRTQREWRQLGRKSIRLLFEARSRRPRKDIRVSAFTAITIELARPLVISVEQAVSF